MANFSDELHFARELARIGGRIAMGHFKRDPQSEKKADGTWVTEADWAVEAQIREPGRESRGPLAQLDEAEAHSAVDDCLAFRVPLGRVFEAAREVHELPATSAIASTIGS